MPVDYTVNEQMQKITLKFIVNVRIKYTLRTIGFDIFTHSGIHLRSTWFSCKFAKYINPRRFSETQKKKNTNAFSHQHATKIHNH